MQPASKRLDWMKRAFESCCQEGCVNQLVLNQIFAHITAEEAEDLLGSELFSALASSGDNGSGKKSSVGPLKISVADLPAEWSRNALPIWSSSPATKR